MRQLMRLVRYVLPFLPQLLSGIFLLAGVGFLEAFRLVLLKPVLDRVFNPSSGSENILLFTMPQTGQPIYLQHFVPTHFRSEAFRLVLLKPVLDRVFNPSSGSENILLFTMPQTGQPIYLQHFVPTHFHNAWTIVAYALVASTVLKGVFDYAG